MKMVIQKLKSMKKAANFIKGFFKMKWYSTVFKEIKNATLIIQVFALIFLYTFLNYKEKIGSFFSTTTSYQR